MGDGGPGFPTVDRFEVGGVIDLEVGDYIRPRSGQGNLYVAGQTAPSPGITLTRGQGIRLTELENAIIQHIRVRPGNETETPQQGDPMAIGNHTRNVVIDHCTFSWGTNQTFQIRSAAQDITVTNNLIYEGLCHADHADDTHCRGAHNQRCIENAVYLGNAIAHHRRRNPRVRGESELVWANNYVFNYGRPLHAGMGTSDICDIDEPPRISFVGNVYEDGPDWVTHQSEWTRSASIVYLEDNLHMQRDLDDEGPDVTIVDEPPIWPEGLEVMPSSEVKEALLPVVGARPADRDEDDQRIIEQFRNSEQHRQAGDSLYMNAPGHGYGDESSPQVYAYPDHDRTQRSLNPPSTGLMDWLEQFTQEVEQG